MKKFLKGLALFFLIGAVLTLPASNLFPSGADGETEVPSWFMDIDIIVSFTLSVFFCSSVKENGKKSKAWIAAFISSTVLVLIAEFNSYLAGFAFLALCFFAYSFLLRKKSLPMRKKKAKTTSADVPQAYTPAMAVPKEIREECKYLGTDLVELTNSGPCCERCAKYRRRIFSLSGKDKRFPKFPSDYEPHGCLSAYPYVDGVMEPAFSCEDIVKYSNRPFVDDRTEEEIKRYENWRSIAESKSRKYNMPTTQTTGSGPEIRMTPLYDLAAKVVFDTQQASVSVIQRRLRLGYSETARMVDYFEECGIVGPFIGSAPRKILISRQEYDKRVKIVDNLPIVDIDRIIQDEAEWRKKQAGPTDVEVELEKVDGMEGHQFEYWCADLLRKNGFTDVEVTQGSGDQGVDVLAQKGGIKYAIQCKCYSSDLGNKPVQEVNTGKAIYRCQIGVVMTNRYFTTGAKQAAEATGVLLWDRDKLTEMLGQ